MDDELIVVDVLESELNRLLEWVRAAETRLALVLPLSTAMLGALAIFAPVISDWTIILAITLFIAVLFLVMSIVCAAIAAFPRTTGPKGSMIYFGGISAMNLKDYSSAVNTLTKDKYKNDLIEQCHRNGQIAQQKFAWVQKSMASLFISAVPWTISLFIMFSIK